MLCYLISCIDLHRNEIQGGHTSGNTIIYKFQAFSKYGHLITYLNCMSGHDLVIIDHDVRAMTSCQIFLMGLQIHALIYPLLEIYLFQSYFFPDFGIIKPLSCNHGLLLCPIQEQKYTFFTLLAFLKPTIFMVGCFHVATPQRRALLVSHLSHDLFKWCHNS